MNDGMDGTAVAAADGAVAADARAVDTGVEVASLRARLLQAELRAEALRAGMVDLDGVKLIDPVQVKVNEAGELQDGAAVMAALRAAKPWLFGRGSSSSAAQAPKAEAPRVKTAMQMSESEWKAARADLLRRR